MPSRVYQGTIFQVPERHQLEVTQNALVVVEEGTGTITHVLCPQRDADAYKATYSAAEAAGTLVKLSPTQYLLPGLIDLHVHAPQWTQLGKALDRSLEDWLQQCTFPLEAKYADIGFAERTYPSLVSTLLANGTTTVAYFASVHVESSVLLAKICVEKGQRAVVGRVTMDHPEQCPSFYRDASPAEAVARSESFIQQVRALPGNEGKLVLPAVIPRFIPSCTHEALEGLAALAKKYDCHVQTHCSESDWEHHHVLERYEKHDAFALDDFGLLTRRTVLAHGNFLSEADLQLVKERGAAVGHCPLSNVYFSDAVFPLKKALDMGVHVGTGTDISGGPSASLFDVCRYGVACARMLESGVDAAVARAARQQDAPARIDHVEAFYVATTLGGVSLDLNVGRIAPGFQFDAIVVDTAAPHSNLFVLAEVDDLAAIFQKIMFNVSPTNIVRTYVNGALVHQI